jgi:hypothetical protein
VRVRQQADAGSEAWRRDSAIKNRPRSTDRILPFRAHDPEKWEPVFGPDHAQSKCR